MNDLIVRRLKSSAPKFAGSNYEYNSVTLEERLSTSASALDIFRQLYCHCKE